MTTDKNLPPEQSETLVQGVIQSLISYIRDNELRVGDPILSEVEFARQLSVSRTVVREAFKALTAMRIIEVSAGRRARVSSFDGSVMTTILSHALSTEQLTPQQIWDVRRAVEIRAVTLACMHRTEKEAKKLLAISQRMREHYLEVLVATECDIEFHVTIAGATRNPLLPVLVSSLTSAIRSTNPIVWSARKTKEEKLEVALWHSAIAEAIAAKDVDAAIAALTIHFDKATSGLASAGFN